MCEAISREAAKPRSEAEQVLEALNILRSEEGSSVTILCDNPDFNGQPDRAIICCGEWTDWEDRRYAADLLVDCFGNALRDFAASREINSVSSGREEGGAGDFSSEQCFDASPVQKVSFFAGAEAHEIAGGDPSSDDGPPLGGTLPKTGGEGAPVPSPSFSSGCFVQSSDAGWTVVVHGDFDLIGTEARLMLAPEQAGRLGVEMTALALKYGWLR